MQARLAAEAAALAMPTNSPPTVTFLLQLVTFSTGSAGQTAVNFCSFRMHVHLIKEAQDRAAAAQYIHDAVATQATRCMHSQQEYSWSSQES